MTMIENNVGDGYDGDNLDDGDDLDGSDDLDVGDDCDHYNDDT